MRETTAARAICVVLAAFGPLGCSDGGDDAATKKRISRVELIESVFKPGDLETSINSLVDSLTDQEPETFSTTVVLKELVGYWEPVKVGANRAIGELQLPGQVESVAVGSEDMNQAQIALVQQRIDEGYGGIGIAPNGTDQMDVINSAVAAGIPVVTIDSDLPDAERHLYIGTNNTAAGKVAGDTLAALIPESEGTVFILGTSAAGWVDGYNRTMAAKDALEAAGYAVVVHDVGWTPQGADYDLQVLPEAVANADPPTVGMLGMFSNAFRAAQVAEAMGLEPGELKIAAFDFEPDTLAYMDRGYIQVTHTQRQYYMGYLVPYALYSINVLGLEETTRILGAHMIDAERFDTGVDVVPAEQLGEYVTFLDSLGIGG